MLVQFMAANLTSTWTSCDLHDRYAMYGGSVLSRRLMLQQLVNHFPSLLVLSCNGIASIVLFREKASQLVRVVDDYDDDVDDIAIDKLGKVIARECTEVVHDKHSYNTRIDLEAAASEVSPKLLQLLSAISKKLNSSTLPAVLIGNIISSTVCNKTTTLQLALAVVLRQKNLIEQFYNFRTSCSYDEYLRFKSSAAAAVAKDQSLSGINDCSSGLVQIVADNFDANISSQNGLRSTHALAVLLTQNQPQQDNCQLNVETIRRLRKDEMKKEPISNVPIHQYTGPKKPDMPECETKRIVQSLKLITTVQMLHTRANELDYQFLTDIVGDNPTPEFGGFNTRMAREQGQSVKQFTKVVYTPLIDMIPSDPTTMMTAMVEAQRMTNKCGQKFTIFTADQQLYRVMVNVLWAHPEVFPFFIPRLGGMHMLMSFVGCVGTLMANSGLEDIMKSAFGGVSRMLTGKNFPQNTRALRFVAEECLRQIILQTNSHQQMIAVLDAKGNGSRTSKMWIDNLIKPVLLMMQFVRAEREGEFALHLWTVKQMMPYFFAARHWNYARYGLQYLRSMERLHPEILKQFLSGEHVMRHKPGLWNGIWSDMFIETTFMRYGHGPGGIVGITLNECALKKWALSLHTFNRLEKDVTDMRDPSKCGVEVITHKEESASRIQSDELDRRNIREKLSICIDPLNSESHAKDGIMNIVTGRISEGSVNVDESIVIGTSEMLAYESTWPSGFHAPLTTKVLTLSSRKKNMSTISGTPVNVDLIYSRVMGSMHSRDVDLKKVFMYELSAIPTSLFEENGDMRVAKSKSVLKRKLALENSSQTLLEPEAIFIDGCAVLWVLHWPTACLVKDYIESYVKYTCKKLSTSDVYLIFDRYYDFSIKSFTRSGRAGVECSRRHVLTLSMPLPAQKVVLTVNENKIQLIKLLCQQLIERVSHMQHNGNLNNTRLIVTGPDPVPIQVYNGNITSREDLLTTHEEADVIIIQQVFCIASNETIACIKVICDDTDVFLLLMYHFISSNVQCKVLMEGTSKERMVTDINATVMKHRDIAQSLLPAHALLGCDTTASLWGVGKMTIIKILKKGFRLVLLGDISANFTDIIKEATCFASACYGSEIKTNMSDVRFEVWQRKTSKKNACIAPRLKCLPPTSEAFAENVKRAHLQTCIWKAAKQSNPPEMDVTKWGWLRDIKNKSLVPVAIPDGIPHAPPDMMKLVNCGCSADKPCATARCACSSSQLPCTVFCKCQTDGDCQNKWTKPVIENYNDSDTDEEDEYDIDEQ